MSYIKRIINDSYSQWASGFFDYTQQVIDTRTEPIPYRGAQIVVGGRPHIVTESMTAATSSIHSIRHSDPEEGILQVFRASTNNIHDVRFLLQGQGAYHDIDEMDYATTAALTASWIPSDITNTPIMSNSSITWNGQGYSCEIHFDRNKSINDTLTHSLTAAIDMSLASKIRLFWRSNVMGAVWRLNISDDGGTTKAYQDFQTVETGVWEEKIGSLDAFTNVTSIELSGVNWFQLQLMSATTTGIAYFDEIDFYEDAGQVPIRIYDFGATAEPTAIPSAMTLDEGVTEIMLALPLNQKIIQCHIHLGVDSDANILTVGNYYGVEVGRPDTGSVNIYGTPTQKYNSGKTYIVEGTSLVEIPNTSMFFQILSIVDAVLSEVTIMADGDPKLGQVFIPIVDISTKLLHQCVGFIVMEGRSNIVKRFDDSFGMPIYTDRENGLRVVYSDDPNASNTYVSLETRYVHKPIATYG